MKSAKANCLLSVMLLALISGFFLIAGCSDDDSPTAPGHAHELTIALEPTGHLHSFRESEITFKVTNDDGEAVTGLLPIVAYQFQDSDSPRETSEGDVVDNNDGTYTWTRTFSDAGVHVVTFKFEHDEANYSNAFPIEVSKAGGERIFCPDGDTPDHAYQIRWTASPGHIHSEAEVTFDIELKRSINETVNTEQPWTNTLDHLTPDDLVPSGSLPTIAVASASGEEQLTVEYKGMGIYRAIYIAGHVTESTTYWLHVTFTDDCGDVDESGEEEHDFQFTIVPGH